MDQQQLNEQVGKRIMEIAAMRMGEVMMETIRLQAANEVMGRMIEDMGTDPKPGTGGEA